MSAPKRIQRKRSPGWRMPEGAVYVGRPSMWGNPYRVVTPDIVVHVDGRDWMSLDGGAWQLAVDLFREDAGERPAWLPAAITELRGHDLACWCPPHRPCHADVLLEFANPKESR